MQVRLFSLRPPSGSCTLLIKSIFDATKSKRAILVAQELFHGLYPPDKPLTLSVTDPNALPALKAVCRQVGITVEDVDPQAPIS